MPPKGEGSLGNSAPPKKSTWRKVERDPASKRKDGKPPADPAGGAKSKDAKGAANPGKSADKQVEAFPPSQRVEAKQADGKVIASTPGEQEPEVEKKEKRVKKKRVQKKKSKSNIVLLLSFLVVGGGLAALSPMVESKFDSLTALFSSKVTGPSETEIGLPVSPIDPETIDSEQIDPEAIPSPDVPSRGPTIEPQIEGSEPEPSEQVGELPEGVQIQIKKAESFPEEEEGPAIGDSPEISHDPIVAEFEKARTAVLALLNATSIPEAKAYVHEPIRTEELMRLYLGSESFTATVPEKIELINAGTVPGTTLNAYLMKVITQDHPEGFPVSIEETEDGYKVDWEAFIQCKDRLLEKFFAAKTSRGEEFYVTLKRVHFGDDKVPLGKKLCFKVSSPLPTDPSQFVYADTNSKLGQELAARFQWDKVYFPVLKMEWVPANGNHAGYMRIAEFVRDTWRKKRATGP